MSWRRHYLLSYGNAIGKRLVVELNATSYGNGRISHRRRRTRKRRERPPLDHARSTPQNRALVTSNIRSHSRMSGAASVCGSPRGVALRLCCSMRCSPPPLHFPFLAADRSQCSLTNALARNAEFQVERACCAQRPKNVRFDAPQSRPAHVRASAILPRSTASEYG